MTYLAHFGLREFPFTLTPQRELYYPYPHHQRIIEAVRFALKRGDGIIKITGEVGTGKTMMCRILMHELKGEVDLAYINNPQPDPEWIIAEIAHEVGADDHAGPTGEGQGHALRRLTDALLSTHRLGRRTVVMIDEAHALGAEGLEAVRRLSNLETESTKLIQLILFGQPELDALLEQPALRQLAQRIPFAFETERLDQESAVAYVAHRIQGVAENGTSAFAVFRPKAIQKLCRRCAGIPRVINVVADKAMLIACGRGAAQVGEEHVEDALVDSRQVLASVGMAAVETGSQPNFWRLALIVGASVVLGAALMIVGAGLVNGGEGSEAIRRLLSAVP